MHHTDAKNCLFNFPLSVWFAKSPKFSVCQLSDKYSYCIFVNMTCFCETTFSHFVKRTVQFFMLFS